MRFRLDVELGIMGTLDQVLLLEVVTWFLRWQPSDSHRHVVGYDEALDSSIEFPVYDTESYTRVFLPLLSQVSYHRCAKVFEPGPADQNL
jgi:hypothetical protein